jgi:hypothetical protein
MRWLIRLLALFCLSAAIAVAATGWYALAEGPALKERHRLGPEDVARARALFKAHDPRQMPAGAERRITLSQADLNLAANYWLQNRLHDASARLLLLPQRAVLTASAAIPGLPLRRYLNLRLAVNAGGDRPRLETLKVGRIDFPRRLVDWLDARAWGYLSEHRDYRVLLEAVDEVQIDRERLTLAYRWQPAILSAVRQGLLPPEQQAAIAAYRKELITLRQQGKGQRSPLPSLLQPLFALAQTRSLQRPATDENRALLLVLAAWASGRDLEAFLPESALGGHPGRFRLTLHGRYDYAQHFLISAGLAANADSTLANAVGLFKEISDVDRGSGFSFTDIAADRAGTRFGETAVSSEGRARQLQETLAGGVGDAALMPPFRDLPEHLSEAEFRTRYERIGSKAYAAVMTDIERRLDAVPLLQP